MRRPLVKERVAPENLQRHPTYSLADQASEPVVFIKRSAQCSRQR